MDKNKKKNKWDLLLLIALLISISGLTFGFLAMSKYVIIQSNTKVKYNEADFKVQFSSNQNGISQPIVIPITYPEGVKATTAYIDNSGRDSVITNLSAEFTKPGQSVTYAFYSYNSGKYKAYLKSIVFNNIDNKQTNKVCTAIDPLDQAVADTICDDINVYIKVGIENETSSTVKNIKEHILHRNSPEPVTVTIEYDRNAEETDVAFSVKFGKIYLHYSDVD